jgi:hypothetical protein
MPKADIDYSNTIIYKITCNDKNIADVYVGHTTNFVQRKNAHKQNCMHINSTNSNIKLYKVIRANGGWNNWNMEIINFFKCKDLCEARTKEQEYFISLNATLNSVEPKPTPKVISHVIKINKDKEMFTCSVCNIVCSSNKLLEQHNKTKKHIRHVNTTNIEIKKSPCIDYKFSCIKCNYSCIKQSDLKKHLSTAKHSRTKLEIVQSYCCKLCDNTYETASGLWKHKKICTITETSNNHVIESSSTEIKQLINIVLEIVKSNTELQKQHNDLQKQMVELCKSTRITNNNNNINNHSNNKTFNLQVFLNEQCKDANEH